MNAVCTPRYGRRVVARPHTSRTEQTRAFRPASDIVESEDKITLIVDLPGIEPANISIKMVEGILTVKATRQRGDSDDKPHFLRRERIFGEFEQKFRLPRTVDTSAIKANFKNGSLHIVAHKSAQSLPRTIEVRHN